jgi:hypothetical protein
MIEKVSRLSGYENFVKNRQARWPDEGTGQA